MKTSTVRKFVFTSLILILTPVFLFAQPTPVQPAGSGTSGDPYQISTLANLYWVMTNSSAWDAYFLQTDDIDASSTSTWPRDTVRLYYGFIPIGNSAAPFTGTYDGNYHYISGLKFTDLQVDTVGFFGYTDAATIKNLGVTNVSIYARNYVGALVGYCSGGTTVTNCYSTGYVEVQDYYVGGLIGYGTNAIIDQCFSTCLVRTVSDSYAGGFISEQYGSTITNSYCTGNVDNSVSYCGGFVGPGLGGQINHCYTTSFVNVGAGFANQNTGTYESDFWNNETTNATSDLVAQPITSSQMRDISTFDADWDIVGETAIGTNHIWYINSHINNGFPFLTWQLHTGFTVILHDITTSLAKISTSNIGFTADSGSVSLTYVKYDDTPPDLPAGAVTIGTYWKVSGASGGSVKLRLYYPASATSSFNGSPTIIHYTGGQWEALPTSSEGTDGGLNYVETTGYYSSFSPVTVADGSTPLPVELTTFTANVLANSVELKWNTATEVNNYGFEIERALDPPLSFGHPLPGGELKGWVDVGFVKGAGNSNSPKQYSFVDDNPGEDSVEYRLKQIDLDGSYKYSHIINVKINSVPKVFSLHQNYPNPFNPTTTIEFTVPQNGRAVLNVYNSIGQKVQTLFDENAAAGVLHKYTFGGSNLASGIYIARLTYGDKQMIKKMLLIK